jgi:FkbM family methyltransferase
VVSSHKRGERDRRIAQAAAHLPQMPRGIKRLFKFLLDFDGQRDLNGRELLFNVAGRFTDGLLVHSSDGDLLISTKDRAVGRQIFVDGRFDGAHLDRLLQILDELELPWRGREFLDVGANIGTTSITLLNRGFSRGYAFEPEPFNYKLLRANLALNGLLDRCETQCVALSNADGTALLEVDRHNLGDHRIAADGVETITRLRGENKGEEKSVPVKRLQSYVTAGDIDIDEVALIWVDVQGHEAAVLAGGATVFEKQIPLFVEYWPYGLRTGSGLDEFEAAAQRSYRWFIDIRAHEPHARVSLRPITEIGELRQVYDQGASWEQTDLLLLGDLD